MSIARFAAAAKWGAIDGVWAPPYKPPPAMGGGLERPRQALEKPP